MPDLLPFQKPFAQTQSNTAHWQCLDFNKISLQDVITNVHPTLLIGVSGQAGIFTQDLVTIMAAHVERPIIFPLSNPTSSSEATPSDLMKWTKDRAIVGTGSPFGNIMKNGKEFRVDQTNNCYIFPGMGLGLIAVKAKRVTDNMFMAAAKVLAECSPAKHDPEANLLPALTNIRDVSLKVAIAVAKEAIVSGLAHFDETETLEQYIQKMMWAPEYLTYRKIIK
jgi:malate dehydrogenase (oxaloacetate-decarboxylating)